MCKAAAQCYVITRYLINKVADSLIMIHVYNQSYNNDCHSGGNSPSQNLGRFPQLYPKKSTEGPFPNFGQQALDYMYMYGVAGEFSRSGNFSDPRLSGFQNQADSLSRLHFCRNGTSLLRSANFGRATIGPSTLSDTNIQQVPQVSSAIANKLKLLIIRI
jgi:hypothetical protein